MRRHVVSAASLTTLVLVALTGCAGNPMSAEVIEETVKDVIAANLVVETVAFELTTTETVTVESAGRISERSVYGAGSGSVDNRDRRMHLVMTMNLQEQSAGEACTEIFVADEWMYISVFMPEKQIQWMKMRMPKGMWQQQNQVQQQIDLLKAADEVNYLGTEDVNGVRCYVVEIVPDVSSVHEMLRRTQEQMSGTGDPDIGGMDLGAMVKQASLTQYIATDGYLFMRTDQHLVLEELAPAAPAVRDAESERTVREIATTVVFSDHNGPATIQLPQGALAATQIGA